MNAAQRRHAAMLAEAGCVVCEGIGLIHHEYSKARGDMKSHDRIVCLCQKHHVGDVAGERVSRHQLGLEAFNEMHNVDLRREAGYGTGENAVG